MWNLFLSWMYLCYRASFSSMNGHMNYELFTVYSKLLVIDIWLHYFFTMRGILLLFNIASIWVQTISYIREYGNTPKQAGKVEEYGNWLINILVTLEACSNLSSCCPNEYGSLPNVIGLKIQGLCKVQIL